MGSYNSKILEARAARQEIPKLGRACEAEEKQVSAQLIGLAFAGWKVLAQARNLERLEEELQNVVDELENKKHGIDQLKSASKERARIAVEREVSGRTKRQGSKQAQAQQTLTRMLNHIKRMSWAANQALSRKFFEQARDVVLARFPGLERQVDWQAWGMMLRNPSNRNTLHEAGVNVSALDFMRRAGEECSNRIHQQPTVKQVGVEDNSADLTRKQMATAFCRVFDLHSDPQQSFSQQEQDLLSSLYTQAYKHTISDALRREARFPLVF